MGGNRVDVRAQREQQKKEDAKLRRKADLQQKAFLKELAKLSRVPEAVAPVIPPLPPAPEPAPPAPPPSQDVRQVQQAGTNARTQAKKRRGISSTLLAGETGGAAPSNPAGGGTLLGQ